MSVCMWLVYFHVLSSYVQWHSMLEANCHGSLLAERLKVVVDCLMNLACCSGQSVCRFVAAQALQVSSCLQEVSPGELKVLFFLVQTSPTKGAYTSRSKAFLNQLVH